MSDVSGIPYMGPMGQGNFFAPQFSYNPQMSAGQIQSAYMPEFYNNQNVVNNLYGGGANAGFGRLTDYYSQLAANQLSGIGSAKPIGFYDNSVIGPYGGNPPDPGRLSYQGGDVGASGATINNDAWRTSSQGPDFLGGGFSSGSLSNFPQQQSYGGPAIDWGGVGQAAASLGGGGGGGMGPGTLSSLGGLGGAGYTPQPGQSSLDWSRLFDFGSGGAQQQSQQQQPPIDYGSLFGRGAGGTNTAAASTPMTYDQMGQAQRDLATVSGAGPGLGGAPAAAPDIQRTLGYDPSKGPVAPSVFDTGTSPITGTQDTGPYGGGAGIGGLDTGRAIGEPYTQAAEPQRGLLQAPVTEAYNPYFDVTSPSSPGAGAATDTRSSAAPAPGGGLTAADLSEQAKARLAELMAKPKEPSPDEVFAGDKPVPTVGQPGLPPTEPTEPSAPPIVSPANSYGTFQAGWGNVVEKEAEPTGMKGRQDALATLKKELQAQDLTMTSGYRDPTDPLSRANPASAHSQGRAFDVRAHTPEQADAAISQIHELLGARGLQEGRDYRIIDEVRNPSPWATGPHVHTQFTEAGMQRYQDQVYQDPNPPRPPADIPYPGGVPLPADRPDAAGLRPAEAAAPTGESPATQTYPGADAPRPPVDVPDPRVSGAGFNALDAGAGPSGVQKAQSFLNRSVESILQQHSPENLGKAGFVMDIKQPLREALKGPFGGAILSGLQPKLGNLGLTQSDFSKAVADPRARFGGEFGGMGGELPSAGSFTPFEGFRQSSDFENRSNEQLGRDQLAELQARGTDYAPGPEVAPTPLGNALGLGNIPLPTGQAPVGMARPQGIADVPEGSSTFDERFPAFDPTTFQSPANDYGTFQGAANSGLNYFNPLIPQRSGYADTIRDDPSKSLQLAARLYSEDQNNPATRQAILEAMLNRLKATGQDPLNPGYYPPDPTAYNDALAKLSGNNDLLNQVYQEMEQPFGGSNTSNYATDWASGNLANTMRGYATPTWTSPSNERFFRKDFSTNTGSQYDTGAGIADKNRRWYESVSSPFPR